MNLPGESAGVPVIASKGAQVRAGAATPNIFSRTGARAATVFVDDANSTLQTCPPGPCKSICFNEHCDVVLLKSIVAVKVPVPEGRTS